MKPNIKFILLRVSKVFIALFWIMIVGFLLYAAMDSNKGIVYHLFNDFMYQCFLLIGIFGLLSIFLEKLHRNISITYLLLVYFGIPILFPIQYFGIPILFAMRVNDFSLMQEIRIDNLFSFVVYIGFFLFPFLSIYGFISWIKEKYETLIICFIVCIFFYFSYVATAFIE